MKQVLCRWNVLLCLLLSFGVVCCNDNRKATSGGEIVTIDKSCYSFISDRDTIRLIVTVRDNSVEGSLDFNFYEKDKSTGTIAGEMTGDTLFANYQFSSEGVSSSRDVAFLRDGNSFIMGTGEVQSSGGKEVFKDRKTIQFDSGVVLKECQ
jgi:hypothetical protein